MDGKYEEPTSSIGMQKIKIKNKKGNRMPNIWIRHQYAKILSTYENVFVPQSPELPSSDRRASKVLFKEDVEYRFQINTSIFKDICIYMNEIFT